jgi:2-dehydro-3-deoxyphosphogluconate aldolase/(4S)-4-hydroxy-2-oxoglutarate aldolase
MDVIGSEGLALASQPDVQIVGILRRCPPEFLEKIAAAAISAGLRAVEVTMDSAQPLDGIRRLRAAFPDVAVGAGTVLGADEVASVSEAGAQFVISPVLSPEVVNAAKKRRLPCLPAAATPTEIWKAFEMGIEAVKVFPADQLGGPAFVRSVLAPLRHVRLFPTGGIDAGNAKSYLEAGAVAVGVGSSVFSREVLESGDAGAVASSVRELMRAVQ